MCKVALVVGVAILAIGSARAQFPGFGGMGFGLEQMLKNENVQKDLKLEADQVTKATDALKKVAEDNKELAAKLRDRNLSREERAEVTKKLNELNVAALKDIIKPEQSARLKQIQLNIQMQFRGVAVFSDPAVSEALKLTDDQKDDLKKIGADVQNEVQTLFQGGFGEETFKKMQIIQKEGVEKVAKMMTKDQKKTWDEMVGKPFEMNFQLPRPPQ
jgi:2'-5' RNA ligase